MSLGVFSGGFLWIVLLFLVIFGVFSRMFYGLSYKVPSIQSLGVVSDVSSNIYYGFASRLYSSLSSGLTSGVSSRVYSEV